MSRTLILTLALAATAVACSSPGTIASTPTPETVRVNGGSGGAILIGVTAAPADPRATTVAAAVGDVWRALPGAFESLAIPISSADSATGVLGNSGFNLRRRLGSIPLVRLIDCGSSQGGPSAETYDVRMTVTTRVRAVDGGTSLSTTVESAARPVAFSGEFIRCSSTGVLESRLADAVKARLAK